MSDEFEDALEEVGTFVNTDQCFARKQKLDV